MYTCRSLKFEIEERDRQDVGVVRLSPRMRGNSFPRRLSGRTDES